MEHQYKNFILQALTMTGQNCLRDFMTELSVRYEYELVSPYIAKDSLDDLKFILQFYAEGWISAWFDWLSKNTPVSTAVLSRRIASIRVSLLAPLFTDTDTLASFLNNPARPSLPEMDLHRT